MSLREEGDNNDNNRRHFAEPLKNGLEGQGLMKQISRNFISVNQAMRNSQN